MPSFWSRNHQLAPNWTLPFTPSCGKFPGHAGENIIVGGIEIVDDRFRQRILAVEQIEIRGERPPLRPIADRIETGVGSERRHLPRIGVAIGAEVELLGPAFARVEVAEENHQVACQARGFLRIENFPERNFSKASRLADPWQALRNNGSGRGRRDDSRARGKNRGAGPARSRKSARRETSMLATEPRRFVHLLNGRGLAHAQRAIGTEGGEYARRGAR